MTPEDLIEDASNLCRLAQQQEFRTKFDATQLSALRQVVRAIELHRPMLFTTPTLTRSNHLIHQDEDWAAVRNCAARGSWTFQIEVAKLEIHGIDIDACDRGLLHETYKPANSLSAMKIANRAHRGVTTAKASRARYRNRHGWRARRAELGPTGAPGNYLERRQT